MVLVGTYGADMEVNAVDELSESAASAVTIAAANIVKIIFLSRMTLV